MAVERDRLVGQRGQLAGGVRGSEPGRELGGRRSHHNHAIGEKIGIRLDADHVIAFKKTVQPASA